MWFLLMPLIDIVLDFAKPLILIGVAVLLAQAFGIDVMQLALDSIQSTVSPF